MPRYDFECQECGCVQEIYRSIGGDLPEKVSDLDNVCCNINSEVRQIIHAPYASIKLTNSEIKELGHLAERNSETMSNDQKMLLNAKHRTKKMNSGNNLPDGMTRIRTEKTMSYDDIIQTANEQKEREMRNGKINKMTDSQKNKWIKDG